MTRRLRVLVIPVENDVPVSFQTIDAGLRPLQELVGGYIEFVDCGAGSLMLNEEGKLIGLPRNDRATLLWWSNCEWAVGQDIICGPAVLMGQPDHEGESTGITPEQEILLATSMGSACIDVDVLP